MSVRLLKVNWGNGSYGWDMARRANSLGGEVFVTLYSIDRRTMLQMLVSRTGAVGSDRCSPQYAFSERTLLDWNLL